METVRWEMTNHSGGGTPRMGDYVLATKYDDGDPRDHFVIGFYDREENGRHYIKDSNGNQMRGNGFRRVERVTSEVGVWILENARTWEELGSVKSVWDYKALHELSAAQSALAEKERELDQLKRQIQSEIELSRELGEQVVAAEARAGEAEKDAERYRWLRDNYGVGMYDEGTNKLMSYYREQADVAIDAARERGEKG